MKALPVSAIISLFLSVSILAESTPSRDWKSTAGTTITAIASACDGTTVTLTSADGRDLKVPLDKLVEEDRTFLLKHFDLLDVVPQEGMPIKSKVPLIEGGLEYPMGETVGPIDAGGGSTCFFYIPKTLRTDRLAPSLTVSLAGGGKKKSTADYIQAAERFGWIVVVTVESKNGPTFEQNHKHATRTLQFAESKLPLDPKRRYFTGSSGGGAMSWMNCAQLDGAGAMPIVGYVPNHKKAPASGDFFVLGGSCDFNRYYSSRTALECGDRATLRFYPGGHGGWPAEFVNEAIAWLQGRWLGNDGKDAADERLDYEAAMITWIKKLETSKPHRALYWTDYLTGKDYDIEGHNLKVVEEIAQALEASDPNNRRYIEGLEALEKFGLEVLAPIPGGSLKKHSTPAIKRAAEKIAQDFSGVPEIEELAKTAAQPTS